MKKFNFYDGSARLDSLNSAERFALSFGACLYDGDSLVLSYSGSDDAALYSGIILNTLSQLGINVYYLTNGEEFLSSFCAEAISARCYLHIFSSASVSVRARGVNGSGLDDRFLNEITKNYNSPDLKNLKALNIKTINSADHIVKLYKDKIVNHLTGFNGLNVTVNTSSILVAKLFDEIIRSKNDIYGEEIVFSFSLRCDKVTAYSSLSGYVYHETLMMLVLDYLLSKGERVKLTNDYSFLRDRLNDNRNYCDIVEDKYLKDISFENRFIYDSFLLLTLVVKRLCENKESLYEAVNKVKPVYLTERYVYTGAGAEEKINYMKSKGILDKNGRTANSNSRATVKTSKEGKGLLLYADAFSFEAAGALCDEIEGYIDRINLDKEE